MLDIQNVTFSYTTFKSVFQSFNLTYNEPGVYGLLGKNGTGKSTLLYLIMGLLKPQSGQVIYNEVPTSMRDPETLNKMFIVPEDYDLPDVSLDKYVKSIAPLYPRFSMEKLQKSLEVFEMPTDVQMARLSMGQKKKIYMCIALATNAELLLLDEPTNGLDIPSKSQFRKAIAAGLDENQTVIISTHQVKDIELLLDHVTIIDGTNIVVNDRIDNLFTDEETIDIEKLFLEKLTIKTRTL